MSAGKSHQTLSSLLEVLTACIASALGQGLALSLSKFRMGCSGQVHPVVENGSTERGLWVFGQEDIHPPPSQGTTLAAVTQTLSHLPWAFYPEPSHFQLHPPIKHPQTPHPLQQFTQNTETKFSFLEASDKWAPWIIGVVVVVLFCHLRYNSPNANK